MSNAEDFEKFFLVGEAFSRGALRIRVSLPEGITDIGLARGEEVPEQALEATCVEGTEPLDLIGTTLATLLVLSPRVVSVLEAGKFTGWSTFPFAIACGDENIDQYVGLAVKGRCGPPRHEKVLLEPAVPGGEAVDGWRGFYFELDTWDGSDVFCADSTAAVIVTEDVKNALEEAGIQNLAFTPLPQWELPSWD